MAYEWEGTEWALTVTPSTLDILLHRAALRQTITYTELAAELQLRFGLPPQFYKFHYGKPAGIIGHALESLSKEWGTHIPPLNVLLINDKTRMPGNGVDGFIKTYLHRSTRRNIDKEDRRSIINYLNKRVWSYQWDPVAKYFGAKQLELSIAAGKKDIEPIDLPPIPTGGSGESKEHRTLKLWVMAHPECVAEFGDYKAGKDEVLIRSGDRLDVSFRNKKSWLAVEIKNSKTSLAELVRGIFQCVKYESVLQAQQLVRGKIPNALAVLITTQKIPKMVQQIAKQLHVHCKTLPLSAERGQRQND